MSHFVAYILQFQEIIVYKIPPGGGGGSIASLRSKTASADLILVQSSHWKRMVQKQWTVPHDDVLAHSSPVGSGPGPRSYPFVLVAGMGACLG